MFLFAVLSSYTQLELSSSEKLEFMLEIPVGKVGSQEFIHVFLPNTWHIHAIFYQAYTRLEAGASRHHGAHMEGFSKTPSTSQQYDIVTFSIGTPLWHKF